MEQKTAQQKVNEKIERELTARANVTLGYLADGKVEMMQESFDKLCNGIASYKKANFEGYELFVRSENGEYILAAGKTIRLALGITE